MQFLGQNNANSAAANAIMMQRLLGTGYELHPLGSRKDNEVNKPSNPIENEMSGGRDLHSWPKMGASRDLGTIGKEADRQRYQDLTEMDSFRRREGLDTVLERLPCRK